jgi:hypothetical protein
MCQGRRRAEARYVESTECATPTVKAQKTAVLTVDSFVNLGHHLPPFERPLTSARVSACSGPYLILRRLRHQVRYSAKRKGVLRLLSEEPELKKNRGHTPRISNSLARTCLVG